MFWNRRNRHLTDEDCSAYIDAELAPSRAAAVEAHLAGCSECNARLEGLRQVRSLVSRLPQEPAPRSFVLTPQMAGAAAEPQRVPARRSSFVLAPAAALTVLVALFAIDLSSSGSNSSGELATAGADQAMVAKDASSAGAAEESAARTADSFSSLPTASGSPQAGQGVVPPVPSDGIAPPTTNVPMTGAPPPAGTPVPPPSTGGPATAPTPSQGGAGGAVQPTPPSAAGPRIPPPATGPGPTGEITSQAQPAANSTTGQDDRDSGPLSADGGDDDEGADWLRIGQIVAAAVFVLSAALVFGPGLLKKGS